MTMGNANRDAGGLGRSQHESAIGVQMCMNRVVRAMLLQDAMHLNPQAWGPARQVPVDNYGAMPLKQRLLLLQKFCGCDVKFKLSRVGEPGQVG
jgi:hypothetical protein